MCLVNVDWLINMENMKYLEKKIKGVEYNGVGGKGIVFKSCILVI